MMKEKKVADTKSKIRKTKDKIKQKESSEISTINEPEVIYKVLNKETIKAIDESWDFRKSNTKEYTHCFHSYPAMMIPQVARRIIKTYGKTSSILFDPYCGTGTSLVEANLSGINAIGTDINPLARLIASTKTTRIDIQVLDLFLYDFMNYFYSINFQVEKIKSAIIPQITNKDFWFSKTAQERLGKILRYIENINNASIRNFFKVAFSETVRESSFAKQGEFKLVRNKNYNEKQEPDVFGLMISKLSRNKQGLIEFEKASNNNTKTSVYDFNTVENIPHNLVKENSIDIVLTSPPYGDSRTTVAYGQYSRLANEWLGYKEANQIDNILMGGSRRKHNHIFDSEILNDVITTIHKEDKERVRDVISFYEDYEKSIKRVSTTIKTGGFACYVVGNRTVKGTYIPTDEITVQLFKENNFNHIETIVRNIPNKRMPLKNSPSNVVGVTSSTMKNEFIVVCQKK